MKYHFPTTLYLCFDGEGDGDGGTPSATPPATPPANPPTNPPAAKGGDGDTKLFTQADLNRILAEDKRKHQERMSQLEAELATLSEDRSLTENAREQLNRQLEDLRKTFRTKEQEIEFQRKQEAEKYQNELKDFRTKAERWEAKYRSEKMTRALQDAAANAGAFRSEQIVALLKPMTELKEKDGDFVAMIDFPDIDEKTGEEIKTLRTPSDAVKRMKELPKIWGNLFESNVVSGVGSGQGQVSGAGDVDVSSLTTEQYMKLRRENPERLGLPSRNRRK